MTETYTGEANPRSMFVEGPFGAGKTTFALETLFAWLDARIPPERILVLVPQRTLARRYQLALRDSRRGPAGMVELRTLGGLAKDACTLYWPFIAKAAGFSRPELEPQFLTIETSQYEIARFVNTAVERGEFDAISVSPQQIAREIIDSLGKAAINELDYRSIPERLGAAWGPDRPRNRLLAYAAAGRVADAYRTYCLEYRLLDYALQIEMFILLLRQPRFREQFFGRHSHLIVEHVEEESSLTHRLVREWIPTLQGALLTYEWDGGHRFVLGADAEGGSRLREACNGVLTLDRSFFNQPGVLNLHREVACSFRRPDVEPVPTDEDIAFSYRHSGFFPEMLDWVAGEVERLVEQESVPPTEIAILAPYLSDALLFSLGDKLRQRGIESLSHRPSRALQDEPDARTLLTLAALAHPGWGYRPPADDVADALHGAIPVLDPIRARLASKVLYHPRLEDLLTPFDRVNPQMQSRMTYVAGQAYDRLREWLMEYRAGEPALLDHFFSRLFGEVLSKAGFGFHDRPEAGRVTAELIESAQKFRQALYETDADPLEVGREYHRIVRQGLLSALYVASWRDELRDAVFVAPAYTFLMRNRPVRYQFWLDAGSIGWWERLEQPLTHPYVLSRTWPAGQVWTDADEFYRQEEMLYRLMSGLIRRCRERIYLGISDLGEQGFEQRGPMLRVFQQILRRHPQPGSGEN
ncbi:MAG: hypothetical protein IT326_03175 [Anaerolineae bacterium]|nr:hypothetical protein [Anaerolineae bacterium]